jgi:fumarylacetoacetase
MTPEAFHLPYGRIRDLQGRDLVGVRFGNLMIDLASFTEGTALASLFENGRLEPFLGAGRQVWADLRGALLTATGSGADARLDRALRPLDGTVELLPFEVADYVDFYASRHHATNVGKIFRPNGDPLTPNWEHLPIGYHGRAGTVVVNGTPIKRPRGQARNSAGAITFGPSTRLDLEAELGFVVGVGSAPGSSVPLADFREHVFGVCLVNDWSARDIQAWEYVPLGPFLGKSFATSIAAWVTPLEALEDAWLSPPPRTTALQSYLDDAGVKGGLDLAVSVEINGVVASNPPYAAMYWTPAQMLAHLTINGASLRTGDLYASGTISGEHADQRGSLLELSWNGEQPRQTPAGPRSFLSDGDTVVLRGSAPSPYGPIALAEVGGQILAADVPDGA